MPTRSSRRVQSTPLSRPSVADAVFLAAIAEPHVVEAVVAQAPTAGRLRIHRGSCCRCTRDWDGSTETVGRFGKLDGVDVLGVVGRLSPAAKARVPHAPPIGLTDDRNGSDRQIVLVGPFENRRARVAPPRSAVLPNRQPDMILERRQDRRHPADVVHVLRIADLDDPRVRDAILVEGATIADVEHRGSRRSRPPGRDVRDRGR